MGPLLANSDYIGTSPRIFLAWDMEAYGLQALQPPTALQPLRRRSFWSSRLANDPASEWIGQIVLQAYAERQKVADRSAEEQLKSVAR